MFLVIFFTITSHFAVFPFSPFSNSNNVSSTVIFLFRMYFFISSMNYFGCFPSLVPLNVGIEMSINLTFVTSPVFPLRMFLISLFNIIISFSCFVEATKFLCRSRLLFFFNFSYFSARSISIRINLSISGAIESGSVS